jgi:hypothetical protein
LREEIDQLWTDENVDEPPVLPPFTGNPGIKVDIKPDASAWSYLQVFVDDGM